jgi:hypothetical protein
MQSIARHTVVCTIYTFPKLRANNQKRRANNQMRRANNQMRRENNQMRRENNQIFLKIWLFSLHIGYPPKDSEIRRFSGDSGEITECRGRGITTGS